MPYSPQPAVIILFPDAGRPGWAWSRKATSLAEKRETITGTALAAVSHSRSVSGGPRCGRADAGGGEASHRCAPRHDQGDAGVMDAESEHAMAVVRVG
jgi:hypothetical protein